MIDSLVSVIIPVYNCEKYISSCVASVLGQCGENFELEILICDDCSTDGTSTICRNLQKKHQNVFLYRNKENLGVVYSRNLLLSKARGRYIAFLDADDYWLHNKLKHQMCELKSSQAGICFTSVFYMSKSRFRTLAVPKTVRRRQLLFSNCIPFSSVLIDRTRVAIGTLPMLRSRNDFLFLLRILQSEDYAVACSRPLVVYRTFSGSISGNRLYNVIDQFRALRLSGESLLTSLFFVNTSVTFSLLKRFWPKCYNWIVSHGAP